MIYTVTFNPAIDYVVHMSTLAKGSVNRSEKEEMFFGGKGINVSAVLKQLGVDSVALGFIAGFTGDAIENGLADMGIKTDFIRLESGCSRINVKIKTHHETEINGKGPDISREALSELCEKLDKLQSGDTLVLAGSVPSSLPSDVYEQILERLSKKGIRTAVDACGELLTNVLKYKPFLIKPNIFELSELFDEVFKTDADIERCARRLHEQGAENVLVSMAGDGALLVDSEGNTHRCAACEGEVKYSVGAGDSMLAGFLAATAEKPGDYEYALKLGSAAGGATAFSEGLAEKAMIDEMMKQLDG